MENSWSENRPESADEHATGVEPQRSPVVVGFLDYLDDQGNVKYSSIFLKMALKKAFAGPLKDHNGVEFIVATETDRQKLLGYFRESRATSRLEDFEERKPGDISNNLSSSPEFCCTKFISRIPIEQEPIARHPLGKRMCGRIPVEVQILTLEDYQRREASETARHEEYKRRQFFKAFPGIFPKRIYAPFLKHH